MGCSHFHNAQARARKRRGIATLNAALVAAPLLAPFLRAKSAFATSKTFSTSNTAWLTAGNWTPSGVPGATDDVVIPGGTADMTLTANVMTIQFITFTDSSSRLLGNGTGTSTNSTLTLNGNGGANPLISVTSGATFTLKGPNNNPPGTGTLGLVLGTSGSFDVVSTGTLSISASISETGGSRGLTKTGAGTR